MKGEKGRIDKTFWIKDADEDWIRHLHPSIHPDTAQKDKAYTGDLRLLSSLTGLLHIDCAACYRPISTQGQTLRWDRWPRPLCPDCFPFGTPTEHPRVNRGYKGNSPKKKRRS